MWLSLELVESACRRTPVSALQRGGGDRCNRICSRPESGAFLKMLQCNVRGHPSVCKRTLGCWSLEPH
jgi:hypothetical protein